MSHYAFSMPPRGHSTAPKFDGDPLTLTAFLDEVETLCNEANINDSGKIMQSRRYAGRKEHKLWGYLPAASGRSFQAFRDTVMALYPGSDDDRRYSDKDLRRLIIAQQTHSITTRPALGAYYREFLRISDFLVKKGR